MEALAAALVAGLGSAASPCLLPLYPSFLAYLTGNASELHGRRASGLLGFFVLAGVLATMLAIAGIVLLVALPLGQILRYAIPVIDGVLILLGVLLLAGRNPFTRLPQLKVPLIGNAYTNAFLYGALLGPIALPCAGPFFIAVLALAVGVEDAAGRVGTLLVYGLGFGLPLLLLSLAAQARQVQLTRWLAQHHRGIDIVAGLVLIGAGVFDLAINWDNLRLTFGF